MAVGRLVPCILYTGSQVTLFSHITVTGVEIPKQGVVIVKANSSLIRDLGLFAGWKPGSGGGLSSRCMAKAVA